MTPEANVKTENDPYVIGCAKILNAALEGDTVALKVLRAHFVPKMMTDDERRELAALDAYWTKETDREMPYETYSRWCDLQVKRRDEAASGSKER